MLASRGDRFALGQLLMGVGIVAILGFGLAVIATVGGLYSLAAAGLVARHMGPRAVHPTGGQAVSLIKPLHGAPHGLEAALETFAVQDHLGPLQILFGLQDGLDPASGVVAALGRRHPGLDIDVVTDPAVHGTNAKVSNLINMAPSARHGVLILSDADISVDPTYVTQVLAALNAPGVGAVSCYYVGRSTGSFWSRLCAMAISYSFLPNAVLGKSIGMAQPCFGSTIALRRTMLDQIGGFAALADHLADDFEIGRRVRATGASIATPPMPVTHLCDEADLRQLWQHELRWARTVRLIDPVGYAGSFITYPLPLALIAAALLGFAPAGLILVGAILLLRIASKLCIDAATGARAGGWWLIPVLDVLSFAVFIASFAGNTVDWQGHRFRVGRDGRLIYSQGS